MRDRFMRFMIGRYGIDALSRFLMGVALVLMCISLFSKWNFLYWIALALVVVVYFRMLSKNIYRRANANQYFLRLTARIRNFWVREKRILSDRRTHRVYKCPNCKQKIRVPKGRGKIEITCPKCHIQFVKKS